MEPFDIQFITHYHQTEMHPLLSGCEECQDAEFFFGLAMALLTVIGFFSGIIALFMMRAESDAEIVIAPNEHAGFLDQIDFKGEVPGEYICPITQCIMSDPVRVEGGHVTHVFERTALKKWIIEKEGFHPLTREEISLSQLISAEDVLVDIKYWINTLKLRHQYFSIWSRGRLLNEKEVRTPGVDVMNL